MNSDYWLMKKEKVVKLHLLNIHLKKNQIKVLYYIYKTVLLSLLSFFSFQSPIISHYIVALTSLSGYVPPGEKQSILVKYAIHPNSFTSSDDEEDFPPQSSSPFEESYNFQSDFQLSQTQNNYMPYIQTSHPPPPPSSSHFQIQPTPSVVSYTYPTHISYQPLTTLPTFPLIPSAPSPVSAVYNLTYSQPLSNKAQTFFPSGSSEHGRYQDQSFTPYQSQMKKTDIIEVNTAPTPGQNEIKYLVVLTGLLPHHDIFSCQFISSFGRIVESFVKSYSAPKTNSNAPSPSNSSGITLPELIYSVHYFIIPNTNSQRTEIMKLHNSKFIIDGANIHVSHFSIFFVSLSYLITNFLF